MPVVKPFSPFTLREVLALVAVVVALVAVAWLIVSIMVVARLVVRP